MPSKSSQWFTYVSFRLTHLVTDHLHAFFSHLDFQKNKQSTVVKLRKILNSVKSSRLSAEEDVWHQKIADLRKRLESSKETVVAVDFGAGSPIQQLSQEQMRKGRQEEVSVAQFYRKSSTRPKWGMLLYKLIKEFKPSICLELGTALGISASYQASALELNKKGHLVTMEGADAFANIAEKNLEHIGLSHRVSIKKGSFQDNLDSVLKEIGGNVDFSFIDGHHDKKATLQYFGKIMPYLQDGAVVVFDDISWSRGMREAWNEIMQSPKVSVSFSVISFDLHNWGIVIIGKPLQLNRRHFYVRL